MIETWYRTLHAAERWDNYTSACSDPLRDLRHAVGETGATRIEIPRRAWAVLWAHPTTVESHRDIAARMLAAAQGDRVVIEGKAIVALLCGVPSDGVEIVEGDGSVRVGDFELRDVIDLTDTWRYPPQKQETR